MDPTPNNYALYLIKKKLFVKQIRKKLNLGCSPLGTVEKVVLECESLSERSVDPALRGFRGF
jgi:hypothetical protein